ncbi:hypothetical protein [Streptomyces sp. NPDC005336]|uniref:hypothetical protein n=1 Tax=Streptomyces sp. NPDC005336 TaxID=3157035 RepID=UPI0033AFD2B6
MHNGLADALVKRMLAVAWTDWDTADHHAVSRSRLMREYLRRSALWAQALGGADAWPIFDIAARVDPSVRADAKLVEQLEGFLEDHVPGLATRAACLAALHWAALRETLYTPPTDLDDPFDPLLMLFERGGGFFIDKGVIDFLFVRVRVGKWQDHVSTEPVVQLEPVVLDALDAQAD